MERRSCHVLLKFGNLHNFRLAIANCQSKMAFRFRKIRHVVVVISTVQIKFPILELRKEIRIVYAFGMKKRFEKCLIQKTFTNRSQPIR